MALRKRERTRVELSAAEEIELVLGPAPGTPSLFRDDADRGAARALLDRTVSERDALATWIVEGRIHEEQFRRHLAAGHPGTDPRYPAVHDVRACGLCHSTTRRLVS